MALLEVNNLHTFFHTKRGTVKAVNDVSYSVKRERHSDWSVNPVPENPYPP